MKGKSWVLAILGILLVGSLGIPMARTQTTGGQSNYIFRFNTGVSAVFLDTMTFASERPLDLGTCTANEKVNGPISCTVNCEGESVCLLELSGPSGSDVGDVMEKASEIPLGVSTPSPAASPAPAAAAGSFGATSEVGTWFMPPQDADSSDERRASAYNNSAGS